jgi:hypothetical protein
MLKTKDLLDHIDALLRLSHDAGDRAISAKLRQLADEFRIMVSVADISDFAATVSKGATPTAPASDVIGPDAGAKAAPTPARDAALLQPSRDEAVLQASRAFQARYAGSNGTFMCSRVGAP